MKTTHDVMGTLCCATVITTSTRVGGDDFELYCVEFPSDNRDADGFKEGNIGAIRHHINGIILRYMGSRAEIVHV